MGSITSILFPTSIRNYHVQNYNNYDILYTNKVRVAFLQVCPKIQNQFNSFTDNLMNDVAISRDLLLLAIHDFNMISDDILWKDFCDMAFLYRRYS